jgi:hypothetical protein
MTGRRTIPFDLSGAIGQIGRTETGIAPAHDLSLTVLFAAAAPVVKAVLVILRLAGPSGALGGPDHELQVLRRGDERHYRRVSQAVATRAAVASAR